MNQSMDEGQGYEKGNTSQLIRTMRMPVRTEKNGERNYTVNKWIGLGYTKLAIMSGKPSGSTQEVS